MLILMNILIITKAISSGFFGFVAFSQMLIFFWIVKTRLKSSITLHIGINICCYAISCTLIKVITIAYIVRLCTISTMSLVIILCLVLVMMTGIVVVIVMIASSPVTTTIFTVRLVIASRMVVVVVITKMLRLFFKT